MLTKGCWRLLPSSLSPSSPAKTRRSNTLSGRPRTLLSQRSVTPAQEMSVWRPSPRVTVSSVICVATTGTSATLAQCRSVTERLSSAALSCATCARTPRRSRSPAPSSVAAAGSPTRATLTATSRRTWATSASAARVGAATRAGAILIATPATATETRPRHRHQEWDTTGPSEEEFRAATLCARWRLDGARCSECRRL